MMGFLWRYLKRDKKALLLNIGFVVLQILVQTVFVMGEMQKILDEGVMRQDMGFIIQSGIRMLLLSLLSGACTVVASRYSAIVTAGMVSRIREDCYKKVVSMTPQQMAGFGESTLLNRTVSDATQIQLLMINLMRTSLIVPVLVLCMLVLIFRMNRVIFWILFAAFLLTVVVLVGMGTKSRRHFELLQEKIDRINLLMKEKIMGVRSIRAFVNEGLEEERMEAVNAAARETAIAANRQINFLSPVSMIIMNWTVVLIYLTASPQLRTGMARVSDLLLTFQYLGYFIASLAVIPLLVNLLPKVVVSCKRIQELLAFPTESAEALPGTGAGEPPVKGVRDGEIVFDDVIFGYAGAVDVITHISLTIPAGKTTAFVGTTGSGKSTLMNLIMGFYEPAFGEIRVDHVPLKKRDMEDYRSHISYATQKAFAFLDTVRNNITMYDADMPEERIETACRAACFDEVAAGLPDGISTVLSQGGSNLSGGQRQRLSLARTVAKDAAIYIFDDTFSALDAKTEKAARERIMRLLDRKTVIMVAQKIDTIRNADRIVVLKQGRIVGIGTHDELLASCEEYQEIYATQNYMEEASKVQMKKRKAPNPREMEGRSRG